MPPKTKMTAKEVAAYLKRKEIEVENPDPSRKYTYDHYGINRDIRLSTIAPTLESIWPREEDDTT